MSSAPRKPNDAEAIEQSAADWVLRHDRGLTPDEQDSFSHWLAVDARHGIAFANQKRGWEALDRLASLHSTMRSDVPDPDLFTPPRPVHRRFAWLPSLMLAAAAAVAIGFVVWPRGGAADFAAVSPNIPAPLEDRVLPDGSQIALNRGAVVTEHFIPGERRVRLERGEAHFSVAHDATRPFVVEAGGVAVRAVGTAFNVRLGEEAVAVLVTEGKVRVADTAKGESLLASSTTGEPPLLGAGQQAVVPFQPNAAAQVATLTADEVEQQLSWQRRLLDFTDAPLAKIVAEFNRHNPVRLSLADSTLGELRLSATFRSDNVEGFVRLMESDFDMHAEWRSDTQIVLRRAK